MQVIAAIDWRRNGRKRAHSPCLGCGLFIWDFRYRISRRRGPELDPPGDGKDVIHVPSASGRELVVNLEPVERTMLPVHRVEAEWPDLCG
jgi:hypothetical protein